MIDAPQIVQSAPQRTASIHVTVPSSQIRDVFSPACRELGAALAAQGIAPAGKLFSYHLQMPGQTFDLEIGLPVDKAVAPVGRVKASELPSMKVARTVYHGNMEGLGAAWGELGAWVKANGHRTQPFLWEFYLVGPDANTDPSNWQTELNWPLAD